MYIFVFFLILVERVWIFFSFSMWLSVGLWDIILISLVSPRFFCFTLKKKLIIWVSYIMHPDCPHFPVLLCIPLIPAPTFPKPSPFFIHSLELGQTPSGQSPKGRLVFLPMYSTQPEATNCEEPCCNMWGVETALLGVHTMLAHVTVTVTAQQRSSDINTYSGSSPDHRHQRRPWPYQDHWLTHGSQWL